MALSFKDINEQWVLWNVPDEAFRHNHEFLRFGIEMPQENPTDKSFEIKILPSYTESLDQNPVFSCVYSVEFEISPHGERLNIETLARIIREHAYPAFVDAFNIQKKDFPAVKDRPAPKLDKEVERVIEEGARNALG